MGCVPSKSEAGAAQDRHHLIEQNIRLEVGKRNSSRSFDNPSATKLLLLGAGESGKSTILKQMKLIHGEGFSQQERSLYAQVMWEQAFAQMMEIVRQARFLGIDLDCDNPSSPLHSHMNLLILAGPSKKDSTVTDWDALFEDLKSQRKFTEEEKLPMFYTDSQPQFADTEFHVTLAERPHIATAILELWTKDSGIKRCFARSNEYQLEDAAAYYFENVHKLADPDYLASDEDVIRGRIKTTGVSENPFLVGGQMLNIIDVGGQRSERKKWIHCFEDVDAVLFVAALSEYDQALYEDSSMNRMQESINLFDNICNSKWFINTHIILFLNKCDLVEAKMKKSPVRKYFPSFSGPNEVTAVKSYFKNLFLAQNKCGPSKDFYVHFTCATDTDNMRFVMTAVTDMVLTTQLKETGII
ncbi:Guanine nucleotide-binding protein alpha-1 subunit [Yarrowia sp. C11]|nr:Guanine nucleotide-binding protein alpha-1 subunit [Yarrowia sp. E02]KAG5371791.1 Guanine nucleotide-binding protein alpha-1 subunit [Yarrowia sp. C11]